MSKGLAKSVKLIYEPIKLIGRAPSLFLTLFIRAQNVDDHL
jgi:hypothetical protein